jgi:gamma-glutamyltranspeptidase/glutathione hydrolase
MKSTDLPYGSTRMPVYAAQGVVATSQALAAQAGLDVLRQGGNAVDAAIATAIALTVVEPTSNGIGGDLFALVWADGQLHGLNSSGRAPAALTSERLEAHGHVTMPSHGWDSVTVPGAPAGWQALHEKFGRTDFKRLIEPGRHYADVGYPVSRTVASLWQTAAERFAAHRQGEFAGWWSTFAPHGRAPVAGERWSSEGHAWTLGRMAEHGVEDFYRGAIAERIVEFSDATDGVLGLEDLAAHEWDWVDPISMGYRGYDVWEIPPSGQGIAALMALGMLEGFEMGAYPHVSAEGWHLSMEAMKLAFADAHRYVADPTRVAVPTEQLLSPAYLAERRALIGPRALAREPGALPQGGTVYLCTADRDGMMVSLIQSNYMGFGSGVVVPDIGVALHNRATGFTLEQGHPNELVPGKRPFHTIIPGFLTKDGQPIGPFGVMGAPMQPQGHIQVIMGTIDHGLNPQAALDAPRWRVLQDNESVIESSTPTSIHEALLAHGHQLMGPASDYAFGRGQIIWRLEDGMYIAGTEPRADGAAVGY